MARKKLAMADVSLEDEQVPLDMQTPQEIAAGQAAVDAATLGSTEIYPTNEPETTDETTEDEGNSPAVVRAKREYMKRVGKLGAERGAGGKALVTFAKTVVEGAQSKVLRASAGKGTGDAKALYESFKRGAEKAGQLAEAPGVVPDAGLAMGDASTKDNKNKSFDVQVSKLNRFLKFGNGFADDAGDIVSQGIATHIGMLGSNVENLKYKSTYAALYELIGEQMKDEHNGVAMTADEMYDFFLGKEPKAKEGIDLVKSALDNAVRALKGRDATENREGREPVSSANLEEAVDALRRTINELDPSGKTLADIDAKAKKADERAVVAAFRASLKTTPKTIETTYTLIPGPSHN